MSGLRDEYHRLIALFEAGAEGKPIHLQDVFQQSLQFFEHLKVQIHRGSPEEKKEAMNMMMDMYRVMMEQTKRISQRAGLSEEQLLAFAENPSNFSPEQWHSIQESRDKIFHAGQEIAQAIKEFAQDPSSKQQEPPLIESHEKKKGKGVKKVKRSDWTKS